MVIGYANFDHFKADTGFSYYQTLTASRVTYRIWISIRLTNMTYPGDIVGWLKNADNSDTLVFIALWNLRYRVN